MSKKEKNLIKDITEYDEETNLFRAEMMNFYKKKTEEELLNEKYRLEIKMYENENNDPLHYANIVANISSLLTSITAVIVAFDSLNVELSVALLKNINIDMRANSGLLVYMIIVNIITLILLAVSYSHKMKNLRKCKQCKIALMCIDDILNERQTVECNDKVKRYYIEVRDRK